MEREPGRIARWRAANIERADHVNGTGRLTVVTRTVLVLLGAATIGVAAVAMFRHDGDVVPTALVLVGAVFAVLGGLGRQVDSVSLKEGGLTYSQWRKEILEEPTPEGVLEAAASAPLAVQRELQLDHTVRRVTESAYLQSLQNLLTERYGGQVNFGKRIGRWRPDFLISKGEKAVLVEVRFGTVSAHQLVWFIDAVATSDEKPTGILLVTTGPLPDDAYLNARIYAEASSIAFAWALWNGERTGNSNVSPGFAGIAAVIDVLLMP